MGEWTLITYMQAGAYAAIMAAVLGVPQMLFSYFDHRARRLSEERHIEESRQDEERRRQDEEKRRRDEEQRHREEELRRQEMDNMDRRHQELMVALIAAVTRGTGHGNGQSHDIGQSELIRTLQQTIENLREENERLRGERDNGDAAHTQ